MSLTVKEIQEIADSLYWEVYEGSQMTSRSEDWSVGFAAGWNQALGYVAQAIDPEAKLATKSFYQRCRAVECPPGHAERTWSAPEGRQMGTVTCECGWTKTCKRRNAQERHEQHRAAMARAAGRNRIDAA